MNSDIVVPPRVAKRPVQNGYPVPFFVVKLKTGLYDFRVLDLSKVQSAIRFKLCWICGEPLGAYQAFLGGPLMAVNRASGEGPCHRDCALYAVRVCPFMVHGAEFRTNGLPIGSVTQMQQLGLGGIKNPGVSVFWVTKHVTRETSLSHLWKLGAAEEVSWWAKGRPATREECVSGLNVNLGNLMATAKSPDERAMIERGVEAAKKTFPHK